MFTIEKVEVKVHPDRQLSSDWTVEEPQDLIAMHGIAAERELSRMLAYPNGAPLRIRVLWFIEDCWYKVTGR